MLLINGSIYDILGLVWDATILKKIYKEMYTMDYTQKLRNAYVSQTGQFTNHFLSIRVFIIQRFTGREWISRLVDLNPETRITMEGACRHEVRINIYVEVEAFSHF